MKRLLIVLLVMLFSVSAYGADTISRSDIVSWDGFTIATYNTDMNTVYSQLNTGVNTKNIVNGTISHEDLADNTRLDYYEEETIGSFVYSGLTLPSTGAVGTATITAGTAYVGGMRVAKGATVINTITGFEVSKTNYVFISETSTYRINTSSVTPNDNEIYIGSVTCNATDCTASDESARATAPPNLKIYNNYLNGCVISRDVESGEVDTLNIQPGEIEFGATVSNGRRINTVSIDVNCGATGLGGIAAADAAIVADTMYYVFAVPDDTNTTNFKGIAGSSPTGVADVEDERLIGWFYGDKTATISAD